MTEDLKSLIAKQGEAFEAFGSTLADLRKRVDVITEEKLKKVEAALDTAVEGKAALEKRIDAERKEREELELRLARAGKGKGDDKTEAEVKAFNDTARSLAASRGKTMQPIDAEGYRAYKSAFDKYARLGREMLSADEVKTLSVGVDPDGGYLVTPDSTGRLVQKLHETSDIRGIADVRTISTDSLEGVEDTGEAGANYAGETATSGNATTPDLGKYAIAVHNIDTSPKATQKLLDDASVDVEAWIADKAAQKIARFENGQFCTGATKIRGFAGGYDTAADAGSGVDWGKIGHLVSGADSAFVAADAADKLMDLVGLLKSGYLANARWVSRRSVINLIRKIKMPSASPSYALWMPGMTAGAAETILNYPVTRAEDMPALANGSLSLAFGDFRQAYQIVDRTGVRVLRDPFTAKPFVIFYTTKRTGGGVINFEAIKLMKFSE
jgi:HK97 family phage major capsid protein